ncbi:MAG: tandem-95 repeat protein, partial [Rubrivivax sp.]
QLTQLNTQAGAGNGLEFVAARMPKVTIFSWPSKQNNKVSNYFFTLTYKDPQTGEEQQLLLSRVDLAAHYAESLVYPEAIVSQALYQHLQARYGTEANFKTEGQWATSVDSIEVERTRLQNILKAAETTLTSEREAGDKLKFVDLPGSNVYLQEDAAAKARIVQAQAAVATAEEVLNTYNIDKPQDPQAAARIDPSSQWLKAIAVDLGNDGISRKVLPTVVRSDFDSLQSDNVSRFDVDNDGFFEATEWLGNADAFLALDRDGNNSIDAASELFNGVSTAFGQRGANSLKYYDANQDGRIDRNDPVFKMLRLWLDLNGDGLSGSLELMDMDMNFAGLDMAALSTRLAEIGGEAEAALATRSPVDYIDLATMKFRFSDGGSAQAHDILLTSQVGGIKIERDTSTSNLAVISEDGVRENYITLVEDMAQLQELKNSSLSAERRQALTTLASKYGLDPTAADFMAVVNALKLGGERSTPTGAIYVSDSQVTVNEALKKALERMRLSVHAVFDVNQEDVRSIITNTATLGEPVWAGSAVDLGASSDGKLNEWYETQQPNQAVSDPLNPAGVPAPNQVKLVLPSDVHALEYAVKGAQEGGLVVRRPVVASNPQVPNQTQTVQVYTTQAPTSQLSAASYSGNEDERFTFGFEQLQTESKTLLAATGEVRLLGVRSTEHGRVEVDEATGRITFVPDRDYHGTGASFTYSVLGPDGKVRDRKVAFNLAAVNDAPVLTGETVQGDEDHPLLLDPAVLLANDRDVEGEGLIVLGIGRVGLGRAVLESTGLIRYTPPTDLYGVTDTLEYVVQDASGATSVGLVKIDIRGVNDAPTVVSELIRNAKEDTTLRIDAALLLANDYDPDVPASQARPALRLTGVGQAEHGSVFLDNSGQVIFVPETNFYGKARFQYKVADETGAETTGWAEVEVEAVNDAVTARGETVAGREDTRLLFDPSVLLANEEDVEAKAGKQTLTIISVAQAACTVAHGVTEAGRTCRIGGGYKHHTAVFHRNDAIDGLVHADDGKRLLAGLGLDIFFVS